MNLWRRITWRVDFAIYRLFYWRWNPRLKRDPDLAYVFSQIGAAWTNGNPPLDPKPLDALIVAGFERYGKKPVLKDTRG